MFTEPRIYVYGEEYLLSRGRVFTFTGQDIYFYGEESLLRGGTSTFTGQNIYFYGTDDLLLRNRRFTFTKTSDYTGKTCHSKIYQQTCVEKYAQ